MRKKTRKIPYLRAFYYLTDIKDATDLIKYNKKISYRVTFKGIKVERLAVNLSEDGKMAVI